MKQPDIILTQNQSTVLEQLKLMWDIFFWKDFSTFPVKPRLDPLIAGPTGAGKSHLIRSLAGWAKAKYFPVTFGSWMPQGTKSDTGGPTVFSILDTVETHSRVILHIDELDKFREDFSQTWSRSVLNDLWNTLDRNFPIEDWIKARSRPLLTLNDMRERVRRNLWIVGTGTWQELFENRKRGTVGFSSTNAVVENEISDSIRESKIIPPELLSRFNVDILLLEYPTTREEKQNLIDSTGITELARQAGVTVTPDMLNFEKGGMREIESIMTRLLLQIERQERLKPAAKRSVRKRETPDPEVTQSLDFDLEATVSELIRKRIDEIM